MKKHYIKIAFVFLILFGIISYILLRNDSNIINTSVVNSQTVTESTDATKKKKNNQTYLQKTKVGNTNKIVNPPIYVADQYNKICNKIDDLFIGHSGAVGPFTKEERNEEELKAFDAVQDKCTQWAEYWNQQNDKEKEMYKKKLKESREMELFFQEAMQNHDNSAINLARSVLSTGGDNSLFSSNVLSYLLNVDDDFNNEIAKRMNVINPAAFTRSIKKNITNIVAMYGCVIDPELACNKDSIGILSLCANFGVACGKSFDQYIYESTTVNQYNDFQQIVAIIINLVKEGYFDSWENEN